MSHITHFYHLSALDYINGAVLNHPVKPSFTASDMLDALGTPGNALVTSYITALNVRRNCHTMGAIYSGRHPVQNAIVPGGASTLLSSTIGEWDPDKPGPYNFYTARTKFRSLLQDVRTFINTTYLPDVLTVAAAFGTASGTPNVGYMKDYWSYGTGYGQAMSYGDYLIDGSGKMLLKRGRVHAADLATHLASGPFDVDHTRIVEYVGYSHYQDYANVLGIRAPGTGKHPWDGETLPLLNKTGGVGMTSYSWMKAPRYQATGSETGYGAGDPIAYEVGPMPRMLVSYLEAASGGDAPTVTDDATPNLGLTTYNVVDLVDFALGATGADAAQLFSVLGRHAARMLEAKFVADAMNDWINDLQVDLPVYTYAAIPKALTKGVGLVEAPRGALGHWIKIEKKKILKYQCVVPSTWNCSPKDDFGNPGPVEKIVLSAGNVTSSTYPSLVNATDQGAQEAVVNIIRLLHAHDFCGACGVHVVTPDGKAIAKIQLDTDGTVKKLD